MFPWLLILLKSVLKTHGIARKASIHGYFNDDFSFRGMSIFVKGDHDLGRQIIAYRLTKALPAEGLQQSRDRISGYSRIIKRMKKIPMRTCLNGKSRVVTLSKLKLSRCEIPNASDAIIYRLGWTAESGTASWKNIVEAGTQTGTCVRKPRRTSYLFPTRVLGV